MATINSVQKSIHLPLTNLSAAPRVLMCSASVGTEGSVTLQLRDTNSSSSSDSNQSPSTVNGLENALTIGYPDPEMLADVLGTLQTATLKNNTNDSNSTTTALAIASITNILQYENSNSGEYKNDSNNTTDISNSSNTNNIRNNNNNHNGSNECGNNTTTTTNNNNNSNSNNKVGSNRITISRCNSSTIQKDKFSPTLLNNCVASSTTSVLESASTSAENTQASVSTTSVSTTLSSSTSTTPSTTITNATTLKPTVQTVSTSTNTTNKTNSYIKNCLIRSSSCSNTPNVTSLAQIMSNSSTSSGNGSNNNQSSSILQNTTNSNSNCSVTSNLSSSSNDSTVSSNSNHSSNGGLKGGRSGISTSSLGNLIKKSRPKLSSPTRHGPQQCQTCSKIFGNASALAKHKLTHSDERKYVCPMCSKAFKRQDHLNGHMMTHRNKKPYECKAEGCGKSYCDARSLRRHTENHHAGIITPLNQSLSPGNNSNIGTPTNSLSLSPATASGDASSPDGATCIRTYISTTGIALTDEQLKAMNLPIKTTGNGVTLLSPNTASRTPTNHASTSNEGTPTTIALTETNVIEGESGGLTREQLDLISKIMQQTKQTSAQVTVSSPTSINSYKVDTAPAVQRPRTWNMQLLNTTQNVSITVDEASSDASQSSTMISPIDVKEEDLTQQLVTTINPQLLNIVKIEQKPVECNLCHRKFKNIPALNGHMRLHGGYFKKDPETKKAEKKEPTGPPLQTASIGVRALIEEKIISRRSKDLNKSAFAVPAPRGGNSIASSTTIRKSTAELESLLTSKTNSSTATVSTILNSQSPTTTGATTLLPAATTIKSSSGLSIHQIGLPQSIEIFSSKQQKIVKNVSIGVGTNKTTKSPTTIEMISTSNTMMTTTTTATTKGTSTDPKDSTLIELLKRGTRIAVAKRTSAIAQPTSQIHSTNILSQLSGTRQIITNKNRTVIIPSDVQVIPTKTKLSTPAITIEGNGAANNLQQQQQQQQQQQLPQLSVDSNNISFADGSPLSLSLGSGVENVNSGSNVYTLTYTSDTARFFDDAEVYNVSDTEMLLQTVDSMQLLDDADGMHASNTETTTALLNNEDIKSEHSEPFTLDPNDGIIDLQSDVDVNDSTLVNIGDIKLETDSNATDLVENNMQHSTVHAASVTTTSLPNFQQFHSKEIFMQANGNGVTITGLRHQLASMNSPMHSPLTYPTPPSSHETVAAQSSPFVDDNHQQQYGNEMVVTNDAFFSDNRQSDFLSQANDAQQYFKTAQEQSNEFTENDKILKLKNVLEEEGSFEASIKVEDLLNSTHDGTECDLREFAETNLSFLDEDQTFLNDTRNAGSPLSEAFFTGSIGTAEEVKQVLRDVMPEEAINLNNTQQQMTSGENVVDMYYLQGFGLQSQMMPNSEDPLLSSSPKEFGQQRLQGQMTQQQQITQESQQQQQQQQETTGVQQQEQIIVQEQQQQQQEQQQQQQQMMYATQQMMPQQTQQQLEPPMQIQDGYGTQQLGVQSNGVIDNLNNTQNSQQQEFAVPHLPQVQTQQHLRPHFIDPRTMQGMSNLEAAMLQPIIYTSSINKGELNLIMPQSNGSFNADASNYFNSTSMPPPMAMGSPTMNSNSFSTYSNVISNLQPLSNQTNSILKRRLRANGSSYSHSHSKYHALTPFHSKLRKPSRTHYTPPPILNPERKGVGLYSSVRKLLASNSGVITFDTFDDDFGDPVGLVDFSDDSKLNLGSAYQAQIPACKERCISEEISETVGAEKMWDPKVQTKEKILLRFLDLSKSSAVPMGSHTEEAALQALYKAEGNTAAAVLALLQKQSCSFQLKWSPPELEYFLKGLERFGKDFLTISRMLHSKTTAECVQMYYFWKKLCVDYKGSHVNSKNSIAASIVQAANVQYHQKQQQYLQQQQQHLQNKQQKLHRKQRHQKKHHQKQQKIQLQQQQPPEQHLQQQEPQGQQQQQEPQQQSQQQFQPQLQQTQPLQSHQHHTQQPTQQHQTSISNEPKPYVCELPDCSASFTSKAALHGHIRIHTYGRNANNNSGNATTNTTTQNSNATLTATAANSANATCTTHSGSNVNATIPIQKDPSNGKEIEFPCKVCGKVFNKVKSRSAHMKTHRVQDPEANTHQHPQKQQQQNQQPLQPNQSQKQTEQNQCQETQSQQSQSQQESTTQQQQQQSPPKVQQTIASQK